MKRALATMIVLTMGHAAAGCGSAKPPPRTVAEATPVKTAEMAEPAEADELPAASDAPRDVQISALAPDAAAIVRIRGVVAQVVGMRLVPPRLIFAVRDNSGTVTALISEKTELSEGARIELVGTYKPIPSPMHTGPGDAPEEPIFVVERYFRMP